VWFGSTRIGSVLKPQLDLVFAMPKKFTRRTLLKMSAGMLAGGALAGAGGVGYTFGFEPRNLETRRVPIPLFGGQKEGKRPVRLIHLSDFHASPSVGYDYLQAALRRAINLEPDLFCITGDFITADIPEPERYIKILRELTDAAPTYAIFGNHDGGSWAGSTYGLPSLDPMREVLDAAGITLLHNAWCGHDFADGRRLNLVGVGDFWTDEFFPYNAFRGLNRDEPESPILLLSHNPDSKKDLAQFPWDLMLCGHTHGGQLVVPLLGTRPFLPIRDKRFAEGLHRWEGRQVFVTRGIGNLHGGRINCPPEISVLELS
jgi:hypothetical protein